MPTEDMTKELPEPPELPKIQTPKPTDKITITVAEYEKLQADKKVVAKITSPDGWEEDDEEVKTFTATLREWDGSYVVDWKFERKEWNTNLREFEFVYALKLWDKNNTDSESYLKLADFVKLPRVEVKIYDKEVKPLKKTVGKTRKTKLDWANYSSKKDGDEVPLVVKGQEISFMVKLPDGRTRRLNANRLNA